MDPRMLQELRTFIRRTGTRPVALFTRDQVVPWNSLRATIRRFGSVSHHNALVTPPKALTLIFSSCELTVGLDAPPDLRLIPEIWPEIARDAPAAVVPGRVRRTYPREAWPALVASVCWERVVERLGRGRIPLLELLGLPGVELGARTSGWERVGLALTDDLDSAAQKYLRDVRAALLDPGHEREAPHCQDDWQLSCWFRYGRLERLQAAAPELRGVGHTRQAVPLLAVTALLAGGGPALLQLAPALRASAENGRLVSYFLGTIAEAAGCSRTAWVLLAGALRPPRLGASVPTDDRSLKDSIASDGYPSDLLSRLKQLAERAGKTNLARDLEVWTMQRTYAQGQRREMQERGERPEDRFEPLLDLNLTPKEKLRTPPPAGGPRRRPN